jgi:hypothetical protein
MLLVPLARLVARRIRRVEVVSLRKQRLRVLTVLRGKAAAGDMRQSTARLSDVLAHLQVDLVVHLLGVFALTQEHVEVSQAGGDLNRVLLEALGAM